MTPHILLIEDEDGIRDLLCDVLESEGYSITAVSHPDEVEPALESRRPDLVLTNIMLQTKSGIDIALELRANGYRETPIIAMSASTTMAQFARQSGVFQATLDKPFDLDRLLDVVAGLATTVPTHRVL